MTWQDTFIKTQQTPATERPAMPVANQHAVLGVPMRYPFVEQGCDLDAKLDGVLFGMGCFWGAERKFWQLDGVYTTAVGYSAGEVVHPTYKEVCTGLSHHAEVVLVVFDTRKISFVDVLKVFWESHNPTQGMRQGNDRGTQYRSGIYCYSNEQLNTAQKSKTRYQTALGKVGVGEVITTEIQMARPFYYAEPDHQQYLHKVPNGYCGLSGTGAVLSDELS